MHEPIVDHIEDYLTRSDSTSLPADFTAHLISCTECRTELAAMEKQARVVRVLRPAPEIEPSPGFYARVLERIEAQRPISIWSIFLQPFGRRIAMAAMALALLMGVYLVSTEPGSASVNAGDYQGIDRMMPAPEDQPAPVLGANAEQERGVVLVNLATYREE